MARTPGLWLGPRAGAEPGGDGALCPQVGSFGTGTALRGVAEVRLVAFLSGLRSFQEAARCHQAALRLLRRALWTCRDLLDLGLEGLEVAPGVPDALAFTIWTRWTAEPVTVTIVPAYRALGKEGPAPRPPRAPVRPVRPSARPSAPPPAPGAAAAVPGAPLGTTLVRVDGKASKTPRGGVEGAGRSPGPAQALGAWRDRRRDRAGRRPGPQPPRAPLSVLELGSPRRWGPKELGAGGPKRA